MEQFFKTKNNLYIFFILFIIILFLHIDVILLSINQYFSTFEIAD